MSNRELVNEWKRFHATQPDSVAVLCTVVKTRGSAYRSPGAKMLVFPDGRSCGIVSGGCLESDLLQRALSLLESKKQSVVVWYDTSRDDDVLFGSGTGCAGETIFLIEKISLLEPHVSGSQARVVCRIFESSNSDKLPLASITCDTNQGSHSINASHKQVLLDEALQVRKIGSSEIRSLNLDNESIRVFFEYLAPPTKLLVFGAGADAQPVVSLARQLDWQVSVVDWRPAYARRERFAEGTAIRCLPFDDLEKTYKNDISFATELNDSVTLIMSHSLANDLSALRFLTGLNAGIKYLGVLGPKKRTRRLLETLQSELGYHRPAAEFQDPRIHFPAGLDIGAETPSEIAVSIIAEITAILKKREGGFLKDRDAPIHDKIKDTQGEPEPSPSGQIQIESCSLSQSKQKRLQVGAVILAAGKAERFGAAKQLLKFNGRSLIENAIAAADAVGCDPALIITGAYHFELLEHISSLENQDQLESIEIRQNPNWQRGIGSSIALAASTLKDRVDALLFIACDQPYIDAALLNELITAFDNAHYKIAASKYGSTFGIPAIFSSQMFEQLQELPQNKGAKSIIQTNLNQTILIDFPRGEIDIDTAQDYASLLSASQ